ncbi:hypothetical protein NAL13_15050, partial [Burkholderia glumae]|nr:hypothetical protein [Burkholderia glumae]
LAAAPASLRAIARATRAPGGRRGKGAPTRGSARRSNADRGPAEPATNTTRHDEDTRWATA